MDPASTGTTAPAGMRGWKKSQSDGTHVTPFPVFTAAMWVPVRRIRP
jgi:hypothetical protein